MPIYSPGSLSEFLRYLAYEIREGERIPPLQILSRQLGISVSCLREQMEVARVLELVEIKPKAGIRRIPYNFQSSLRVSLSYASAIDKQTFETISDLRAKLESAYWYQAVSQLSSEEKRNLLFLVENAEEKIHRTPSQNPHQEHREFHLAIFRHLDNFMVSGILGCYWELYEVLGMNTILHKSYLEIVWNFHRRIAEAIVSGDYEKSFDLMNEHLKLIQKREQPLQRQRFE